MDSSTEARAIELAARLLDASDQDAASVAAELAREPAELRARVERLHASALNMGDFLERSPLGDAAAPVTRMGLPSGTVVGTYAIVGLLGQGGTADVYEATAAGRAEPVAIKIVKPGVTTADTRRRFAREFQTLSRLEDPRIAGVLDSGAYETIEGERPFVVMELVRGTPLNVFARERDVDLEVKLLLMAEIASAVQHAHQRGVIHRDLKPSNVMITAGPKREWAAGVDELEIKVLDFGIAKIIGVDTTAVLTTLTDGPGGTTAGIVGTLPYMSPEQVSRPSDTVDFRTDIYSLGVMLYELLTGRLPIDPRAHTLPGMLMAIVQQNPERMFPRARGRERDLEVIVGRAMAKRPESRYQTAEAFAADLRAVAAGRAPSIRPPSLGESVMDLYRRHRLPTLIAAAALAVVVGTAAVASVQWMQARTAKQATDEAFRKLVDEASVLVFDVERTVRELPGSADARRLVVERAVAMYETARLIKPNDEDLLDRLAAAYGRLASASGSPGDANVGNPKLAQQLMQKSLGLRRLLAEQHPESANLQASLAVALLNASMCAEVAASRWDLANEAMSVAERAVALINASTLAPRDILRIELRCVYYAAQVCPDAARASELFARAITIARKNAASQGASITDIAELGLTLRFAAEGLVWSDSNQARTIAIEAMSVLEPLWQHVEWGSSARPHHAAAQMTLAAALIRTGDLTEGQRAYAASRDTLERQLAGDADNGFKMSQLSDVCQLIARAVAERAEARIASDDRQILLGILDEASQRATELIKARAARGELDPDAERKLEALRGYQDRARTQ